MVEFKTVINDDGYIIDRCVEFKDGISQCFEMKEGYRAVDFCKEPLVKGRMIDEKFIETATEEEKENFYKSIEM